ncbi:8778_t:CDS:1, partial [Racocetra persica]
KVDLTLEEVEKERAEIAKELSILKSKERKHRWYEQKKKERMDSGFGEAEVESLNNNNNESLNQEG